MRGKRRLSISGTQVAALLGAVALSLAGLVWLMQSSALTACGRRIANLQGQRSELLERRSEALLAYARATAPDVREARARELGFAPPVDVTLLPVDFEGAYALEPTNLSIGGGPLEIVAGDELRAAVQEGGILSRWRTAVGPAWSAATGVQSEPEG